MKYIHYNFIKRAIFTVIVFLFFAPFLKAQFTITENFKGNSVASNIILGGNPSATLTSGVADPINNGWLRLTTDATNQKGYAYINTPFPSSMGVYMEFEYKTWRTKYDSLNGADGFSVFLFDATTTPFRIGGFGGSLGYAQKDGEPGLKGAYLGIGFDEFGNFGMASEGRKGGMKSLQPNSVVLRGPKNSYRYLTHKKLGADADQDGVNSIDYNVPTSTRPTDTQFYRRVKIYIEPEGTLENPKYRIRVIWRTSPTSDEIEHINYVTKDPIPKNLKMGLGASTGWGFNYHEIRNLFITTTGGVRVQKEVSKVNALPGDELTYTINVHNEAATAVSNLIVNDVMEDGNGNNISISEDFEISSITFNNNGKTGSTATGFTSGTPKTSGFTNPFSTAMTLEANSSASFTIVGTVKNKLAGKVLKNSVALDVSNLVGFVDTDLTNNYSTVSTTILNPNVDLKIEKGVSNNGIAQASGNIYSIVVSNVSSINKPATNASKQVTVTDVIPAGLNIVGTPSGTGWTLSRSGNTLTFTRRDALQAQYAYPPITINVTPSPGGGPWTNTANLTYVDDINPDNNSSSVDLRYVNYWHGTIDTDWAKTGNWTASYVPATGQDIEFATDDNNGPDGDGNGQGTAINDLHLDKDRIIGDLINKSDKDLIVTIENQLVINEQVRSDNTGGIVVKADPNKASGTLIFKKPVYNSDVVATVQFYNKAHECDECGLYRKQWQYFGIPVQSAATFPVDGVSGNETVNQWVEPYNGNKWQTAPYTPDVKFTAFRGYEMTNSSTTLPTGVYSFPGTLYVGNAIVPLTKTANVNYSGANLIGNSYTAAIPIATALATDITDKTVYLFNTGTRDQWRRLNGSYVNVSGVAGGQYLAVPFNLAGQIPSGSSTALPSMIPATHAFMLLSDKNTTLNIDYSKLVKNQTITDASGNQIATRAGTDAVKESIKVNNTSKVSKLASLVMDVVSDNSADRVWIFSKPGTTYGFDSGWDGQKMGDESSSQLYVSTPDKTKLQVATVPDFNSVSLGFVPTTDGTYTLEFAPSDELNNAKIYLNDLLTGKKQQIVNGGTYLFTATKGEAVNRFSLSYTAGSSVFSGDEALIHITTDDGVIKITNESANACSISISDDKGHTISRGEVSSNSEQIFSGIADGTYIVRLQNANVNDMRSITLGN